MLEPLRRGLEPVGLNLIGVAAVGDYDQRVRAELKLEPRWPATRSAIVIGNGGSAFWQAARSSRFAAASDPLDRFAEHCLAEAMPLLSAPAIAIFPHRFAEAPVSFMHLAECAGLGVESRIGILIRPDYGTWFALRAALLLDAEIEPTPPLAFDPCPPCDGPCVAACPGAAVTTARGWDIPLCVSHRLEHDDCGDGCYSRVACPYGAEHRYAIEEVRHHQAYAIAAIRDSKFKDSKFKVQDSKLSL